MVLWGGVTLPRLKLLKKKRKIRILYDTKLTLSAS